MLPPPAMARELALTGRYRLGGNAWVIVSQNGVVRHSRDSLNLVRRF
jgi:hypothetical protein